MIDLLSRLPHTIFLHFSIIFCLGSARAAKRLRSALSSAYHARWVAILSSYALALLQRVWRCPKKNASQINQTASVISPSQIVFASF